MVEYATNLAAPAERAGRDAPSGVVRAVPFQGDEVRLVEELRRRSSAAAKEFYDRYATQVEGLLFRLLGADSELEDVIHDVFVEALAKIDTLRDANALRSWLMGVTVRTARRRIQKRARRWWLRFMPAEQLPERATQSAPAHVSQALGRLYVVLDQLSPDERIALVLRRLEGMTLVEGAVASGVSLATFKRRLKRGELALMHHAMQEPSLREWLEGVNDD